MKGLHLTADLYRCRCEAAWLCDARKLQDWCAAAVAAAGLESIGQVFQPLPVSPAGRGGVSATMLMAGSHVCLHTWPEEKTVTADVYVSNARGEQAAQARGLMDALVERFQPEWTEQRSLDRGEED